MGILFYEHEVLQVECVIVKYQALHVHTSMTHFKVRRVVEVVSSSSERVNH